VRQPSQIWKEAALALHVGSPCFSPRIFFQHIFFTYSVLFPDDTSTQPQDDNSYLVFARKYRPQNFNELIGQAHLVEILSNAFTHNRIAHAYILNGIRGVGKTTTARIIAKGLNCLTHDRPTTEPCGHCSNCVSITAGKNIDVFEMDAASRTGIDDIREIIDSVPYKPLNCRYKVYIIDEIHMLSKQAFNGLLKTLEEPPSHVKFIFATTEIHKVLPTILSRCQKIDLKRVDIPSLTQFFGDILTKENITFDVPAIAKIARSSDGSVRDGLSLLDQAVAASPNHIDIKLISEMLGTVQGDEILDILASCLHHQPTQALDQFDQLHSQGFDCHLFIKELLRTAEWLMRAKFKADTLNDPSLDQSYLEKARTLLQDLEIHIASRIWDIAFKAMQDIKIAPDPKAICEIALIRMNYGLSLPDPAIMMKNMTSISASTPNTAPQEGVTQEKNIVTGAEKKNLANSPASSRVPVDESISANKIETIEALFALLSKNRFLDLISLLQVKSIIHQFKLGYIRLSAAENYTISLKDKQLLQKVLKDLTHQQWDIEIQENDSIDANKQSLFQEKQAQQQALINDAKNDPNIKIILDQFPNAKITQIKDTKALPKA